MTEQFNATPAPAEQQAPAPYLYPTPLPVQKKPWYKKPAAALAGVAIAGLLVGGLAGGAYAGAGKESCIKALDHADEGFKIAGDAVSYAADGIKAATSYSVSGLRDASDGMKEGTAKIKELGPKYISESKACRG